MSTPDLLATIEVAERLGVERSTLSRWVQLGKITPAMRLPGPKGAFLFAPDEVARVAATLPLEPCAECGRPSATRLCSECEHRPEAA